LKNRTPNTMSEKKRKRQDNGIERPKKKAAVAQPSGTVRVEFVDNKDVVGPVLGTAWSYASKIHVNV
jgi:hypothetical protein